MRHANCTPNVQCRTFFKSSFKFISLFRVCKKSGNGHSWLVLTNNILEDDWFPLCCWFSKYFNKHLTAFQTCLLTWYFSNCPENKTLSRNLLNIINFFYVESVFLNIDNHALSRAIQIYFQAECRLRVGNKNRKHENPLCIIFQPSDFMVLIIVSPLLDWLIELLFF